jgi:S-adenosylmethionine/arginine decarboxylase-like enzyme
MFNPNHLHLIVRGHVNNPPKSSETLNAWLKSLVDKVGMAVVAGPTSVYVDEPGNEGITGTITLATSHAAIHVWDAETPSLVQFDIYSCKEYSIEKVLDHINEFDAVSYEWIYIDRNNGLKPVSQGKKENI